MGREALRYELPFVVVWQRSIRRTTQAHACRGGLSITDLKSAEKYLGKKFNRASRSIQRELVSPHFTLPGMGATAPLGTCHSSSPRLTRKEEQEVKTGVQVPDYTYIIFYLVIFALRNCELK